MDLSTIQPLLDWMAANPELSGFIIFLIAAGESLALVGIIVPGVVFMLGIGALVGLNAISLWQALIWAIAGAIVGDWFSYWLGRHFDRQLRHIWPLSRYPKLIPRGEAFFKKHGGASVLFGRFVGPLRPIIPAVAGIMHMPQGRFYFINAISAILWAPVVILPGVAFGESIQLANVVFIRLIALVAITIVVAVVLGYFIKKLVSYTLMETIETLGEYFGFRAAKESMLSLALLGAMAVAITVFVYKYEIQYKPLVSQEQAMDRQWWKSHWSRFSRLKLTHDINHPVTFQWWGALSDIKKQLVQLHWITPPEFNVKTSLNYFLPEPDPEQLPVWSENLFGEEQVLLLLLPGNAENKFYVLRMWAVTRGTDHAKPQLWLGTVHSIKMLPIINLVRIPITQPDYSQSIALFYDMVHSQLPHTSIERKTYPDIGTTKKWNGDVLLLDRADESNTLSIDMPSPVSKLRQVGDTGLFLRTVHPFQYIAQPHAPQVGQSKNNKEQKQYYQLVDGGLNVNVSFNSEVPGESTFSTTIQAIKKRLEHAEGLQLLEIQGKPLSVPGGKGAHLIARYDMPPFGKQLDYHVLAAKRGAQTWIVTTSNKYCDTQGLSRLEDMLASFSIP